VRTDGIPVGLVAVVRSASTIFTAPLNVTADGLTYLGNNAVWTGATSGTVVGTAATTCNDWTSNASTSTGGEGRAGCELCRDSFDPASRDLSGPRLSSRLPARAV
jgi:hypothetical protein